MNKSRLSYFACLLVFLILACQGNETGNAGRDENILHKPPFASLTDSINRFPGDGHLYFRRAELLSQTNNHAIARADYKKAWELDPSEATGTQYAANLEILGDPAGKLKLLQECTARFPANMNFRRLTGQAYAETGRSPEALTLYDSMLKAVPEDFETWYEKGVLLETLRDTAAAIQCLNRAYTLQPVNTYALELAHLYAESGNARALEICDQVIAHDLAREIADPFFIKGIYYSNTKKYDLAITQFDSCIKRDWKFSDAYIEKGIAYFKQNNFDNALNTFHMAATVSNTNPDAYYWMGRCYEAIHQNAEAIDNYERAAALDKNFTEAREALKRLRNLTPP